MFMLTYRGMLSGTPGKSGIFLWMLVSAAGEKDSSICDAIESGRGFLKRLGVLRWS
jgi:hypothetical protein